MLLDCLAVGCGGFIGSVLRFLCSKSFWPNAAFPFATMSINAIGSFAILFLTGLLGNSLPLDGRAMLLIRVGLCGGFTTFSTFSSEVVTLLQDGNIATGLCYALASCVICVLAAFAGHICAGLFLK